MELLCVYIYRYISLTILSKEVEKLNFRQYGPDEKQSRAEAERRESSEEKESEERRCRCAKR